MEGDSPIQAQERYERFIRSAVSNRVVWALKHGPGLATWRDEEADSGIVPFWSDRDSAAACAAANFHGYSPESFDLEFFVTTLLLELEKNSLWVSTNPTAEMTGIDLPARTLHAEISAKLAKPPIGGNVE